jgi:hypothetical protein
MEYPNYFERGFKEGSYSCMEEGEHCTVLRVNVYIQLSDFIFCKISKLNMLILFVI